ncbi:MAG: F0F1 ATP synthase subunit B [Acidimicrobiaceae bacterium]|nr:F0F1 ATP synthase subunit B [Acidimicrobiia bacterium]MCY4493721.1 F0F1 ATP synthase subunit B [Acidimicrobiaceae bacterium]
MTATIRRLAGAFGLIGALTVLSAVPASAVGETPGTCIFEKVLEAENDYGSVHALEDPANKDALAAFEQELDTCEEAPSLIIPEIDEIIWGGGAFLILFGFMWWKGFPAVQGAMQARSEKIAADLDAAESAKTQATTVLADHEAQLAGAKAEAAQIVEDARAQADLVAAEIAARANEEMAQMRARAAADIESARSQAVSDLRGVVADIAVGAAERVIKSNLDIDTQRALVDAYIDEVAASNA